MNNRLYKMMNWPKIEEIIYSECDDPHTLLGPHKTGKQYLIQAYFPGAKKAELVFEGMEETIPMELADEDGYFAALVPGSNKLPIYHYIVEDADGNRYVRTGGDN